LPIRSRIIDGCAVDPESRLA